MTIAVELQPRRIVSLAPSNTEILYALGLQEEIIAVTRFCDYPAEAKQKPKVGGWSDSDVGKVKELKPNLVLTSSIVQEQIAYNLKNDGVNIVHLDPRTLEQIYDSILTIGRLTNTTPKANELVRKMKEKIAEISERVKNVEHKPRVYIEEWHKPPTVSGNWIPKLVELAQGEYGLIKEGEISRPVTTDEVVNFNPEYIVISWCGFHDKAKMEWLTSREGWDKIDAVKNNRVFVFDDCLLNRPGPRLVDGLEAIVKTIHSEVSM